MAAVCLSVCLASFSLLGDSGTDFLLSLSLLSIFPFRGGNKHLRQVLLQQAPESGLDGSQEGTSALPLGQLCLPLRSGMGVGGGVAVRRPVRWRDQGSWGTKRVTELCAGSTEHLSRHHLSASSPDSGNESPHASPLPPSHGSLVGKRRMETWR